MPNSATFSNSTETSIVFDHTEVAGEILAEITSMPRHPVTLNTIIELSTLPYLDALVSSGALDRNPKDVEADLIAIVNAVIRAENMHFDKGDQRYTQLRTLTNWQIAQVLLHLRHTVCIRPEESEWDPEYDVLAMYQPHGAGRGTYTSSEDGIRAMGRKFNAQLTLNDFKEVVSVLRDDSPRTTQTTHRDLIAVNNGIVSYATEPFDLTIRGQDFHFEPKKLHDFDPAFVFLAKSSVNYVEDAQNPVITHSDGYVWDVESWIAELFDEDGQEGLADLIWEVIGAAIRPHVRWGKTAWFYSEAGNNGKGTLCALMRNLIGPGAHTSIPLSDFGKDFALEPLLRANAIIVDENDVGTFIDQAANLKSIVTNDVIQINRKYRAPIAYQFWGLMVQCLNEFPRVKDKSDSFYRRQLFVPFAKSFTGAERKYIKNDYLQRSDVLEYALWYVINRAGASTPGNYYEFSEPLATQETLSEYKMTNDAVREFWGDFREEFAWDLLPFPFLYDLYKNWFRRVSPSGSPLGRKQFIRDLVAIVESDDQWYVKPKKGGDHVSTRPGYMMNDPEPLIAKYELTDWYSPGYKGDDPDKLSRPHIAPNYRGVLRKSVPVPAAARQATTTSDAEEVAA